MTVIYHTDIHWIATVVHIIGVLVVGVPVLPFNNIHNTILVLFNHCWSAAGSSLAVHT